MHKVKCEEDEFHGATNLKVWSTPTALVERTWNNRFQSHGKKSVLVLLR